MTSFNSARIKLTIWYILIVAIISFSFSAFIHRGVISEIERGFQIAEFRLRDPNNLHLFIPREVALDILSDDLEDARKAVTTRLIIINGIIIVSAGLAGYFLAGKTLQPIEAAVEEQKRFTADASHELKTPLTSLRTELEVAIRDNKISLKDAKNLLKSNLEEVINLQRLSENLMKLTRYSQGNNGLKIENLDFMELIKESIKTVRPMATKKEIKIINEVNKFTIQADRISIIELLVILLDNAVKYSPKKSVVVISSELQRNKVIISVQDKGIGIASEDLPHLFDRFYRSDLSRNKSEVDGYGLGLAIAKEIVDKHKGTIVVRSILGKGSAFTVSLPL